MVPTLPDNSMPVDADVLAISVWLRERCGIDYQANKLSLLQGRLQQVVQRLGLLNLNELNQRLASGADTAVASAIVQLASTNHTYFFREPRVLDHFRRTIFPYFSQQQGIRIWSAAASTGDEAYTVAILAAEHFGLSDARQRVSILGTDISARVIHEAERGCYEGAHIDQMPDGILGRYFKPTSGAFTVADEVRAMCTFRRLNLKSARLPFRSRFDVVLCRNVLYYFARADQIAILEAIYDVTVPGGFLLTSVTETIRDLGTRWQQTSPGVFRSKT